MANDDLPGIAEASGYLIEGWVEAESLFGSGRPTDRRRAAASLCRTLTRLDEDDFFWKDMWTVDTAEAYRAAQAFLNDLQQLLELEKETLVSLGMSPEVADQLLQTALEDIYQWEEFPDRPGADLVKTAVDRVARQACLSAGYDPVDRPRALPRPIKALAGAVLISGNVAGAYFAPVPGLADASIGFGFHAIYRTLPPNFQRM